MNFLVISDIHCTSDQPLAHNGASSVSSKLADGDLNHPFSGIPEALKGHDVDVVLCPGDITDKAEQDTLLYAWDALNKLSASLEAELIACAGNHDLDSRYRHDPDPAGLIMTLNPPLPVSERVNYLEYWAENFTVLSRSEAFILIVNTAAFHGGGEDPKKEIEYGRISNFTLDKIKRRLQDMGSCKYGVLLCHHHLARNNEIREDDYSEAIGGQQLINELDSSSIPWLVVHGHKHRPRIFYSQGGGRSPIILSAASFSANVRRDAQNHAPNQMHLVSVDLDATANLGEDLVGLVRSWNWRPNLGWEKAIDPSGLPYEAGFGARGPTRGLAQQLKSLAAAQQGIPLKRAEILAQMPALQFVIPADMRRIMDELAADDTVAIAKNEFGALDEIGVIT